MKEKNITLLKFLSITYKGRSDLRSQRGQIVKTLLLLIFTGWVVLSFFQEASLLRRSLNNSAYRQEASGKSLKKASATVISSRSNLIYSILREKDSGLLNAILYYSRKYNLEPTLVISIIEAESRFNPYAVSAKGAVGLMQILPSTAEYISKKYSIPWRGRSGLFNPSYNILIGCAYLHYLMKKFNQNLKYTLMAYNWGPSNTKKMIKKLKSPPSTTKAYVRRVVFTYSNLEKLNSLLLLRFPRSLSPHSLRKNQRLAYSLSSLPQD
ncbi:MAG: lytic transglycosylase domain-containing protein [Candidatus Dadabacteria bacterium]|nr:MAG: lytic transglycosylase domain-containing protein [Candidatus Dadabacteria bacterium]